MHLIQAPLKYDGKVLQVRLEAKFLDETGAELLQIGGTQVKGEPALIADHVVVLVGLRHLVPCGIPTQVYLRYQVKPFKKLKYAVYGGDVQIGICLYDLLVNRIRRLVPLALGDGLEHHQTLRRQAVSRLSKGLYDRVVS